MSKALTGLTRLSEILKLPFRGEAEVLPRRDFPPGFAQDFFALLKSQPEIGSGEYQLLDGPLPIQEGRAQVDFVAGNRKGDLVFIWVFEKIGLEGLCRLIPSYDWIRKNRSLFQHLYISGERAVKLKVWVFAREIEGEVESMLPYVKEISLKLFKIQHETGGAAPMLQAGTSSKEEDWGGAKAFSRNALAYLKAASPALPSITAEEAKDLTRPESAESPLHFEEDEITDPLIHLSDLKIKEG